MVVMEGGWGGGKAGGGEGKGVLKWLGEGGMGGGGSFKARAKRLEEHYPCRGEIVLHRG